MRMEEAAPAWEFKKRKLNKRGARDNKDVPSTKL